MSLISKIQSLISSANAVTGESRTDLTSAVQDLKDGYGGGTIILPSEYQKVDYLTSTGTQRIETGLVNNAHNVPIKYEFGVNYSDVTARQLHGSQGAFYVGVVNGLWQVGQGGTSGQGTALANTWYSVKYYASGGTSGNAPRKGIFTTLDDDMNVQVYSFNSSFDVSNDFQICVFSLNGQTMPSTCSVSYFKVWQDGILQRHLIPCYRKSDNEIGMYDIVNGVFYSNAGTGSFTCYPTPPTT